MAAGKGKMKSELSKTDVKIVLIVVTFLLTIILGVVEFMYLYQPTVQGIEEANQTLDGLEIRLEEAKRVPQQILFYEKEIDILEGKTVDGEQDDVELRQEIDVPTILEKVETSATSANMQLKSILMDGNAAYIKGGVITDTTTPDGEGLEETPEVNPSAFYRLGISMEVTSVTYEGLMQFLQNVEDAGYYITTSSAVLNEKIEEEENSDEVSDTDVEVSEPVEPSEPSEDETEIVEVVEYEGTLTFYIYSFVASSK